MLDRRGWLSSGCLVLAAGLALNALLGPLATSAIDYRYTETYENQGIGLDIFALVIVIPLLFLAGVLAFRRHPAAGMIAVGPALMAAYMTPQYILGAHYLTEPGNNERFFLLHLGLFVVSSAVVVLAWHSIRPEPPPSSSPAYLRWTGIFLLGIAVFLVLRYLPALADIWADRPADEYLEDPIAFWLIALLDLGIFLPVAAVAGIALLRGEDRACRPMYAVVAWFVLVGPAVAAMAFTMELRGDPHGSLAGAIGFTVVSIVVAILAGLVLRPVLAHGPQEAAGQR